MKAPKIKLSLLRQAVLALIILLVTMVIVALLVFTGNRRLIDQAYHILHRDMPVTINTLEMIDEVNDIYMTLLSYVNGDMASKAKYYQHLIEYTNYRNNIILLENENQANFIHSKHGLIDSESQLDQLEFIDRYFATFREDVEQHIFSNFDPEYDKMKQDRATQLRSEISRYILDPLLDESNGFGEETYYPRLVHAAIEMYESLYHNHPNKLEAQETYFTSLQYIQTKSTAFCLRNIGLDCDNITRKLLELKNLGSSYFESNFNASKDVILSRVISFEDTYVAPLQTSLEQLSYLSNKNIQSDIAAHDQIVRQIQVTIVLGASICIGFLCVLFMLIWYRILKPLSQVSKILGRLSNHQYDVKIPERSETNEIGIIYSGLKNLRHSLIELQALRENQMKATKDKHDGEIKEAYLALKESENNLRIYTKKLEAANKDLEQFIHIASHDLREPLKNILGLVQIIRHGGGKDLASMDAKFEQIQSNILRMEALIDDLRVLTKMQSMDEKPQKLSLSKVFHESYEESIKNHSDRSIQLELQPLPEIEGYERYLKIVFNQIITNALQYGSQDLHIRVETTTANNNVKIGISNNLSEKVDISQKLILPFKRGNNATRENSGVGLAVCRKIVEDLHHGQIELDESDEDGFTVLISLPIKQS